MIPGINKRALNFYDLMLYVALARKHLRLMVLLVCMSLMTGLTVYVYSRPVFYARSLVRVESWALPVDSDSVYHDSNLGVLIAQFKSPPVMEATARRLGADVDFRELMSKYIRQIKITPSPEGTGLEVDVYSYNQSWPARWTAIMVEEFVKQRADYRQQYRDQITRSWGSVMDDVEKKMDANLDMRFSRADQNNLITATINMNQLRDLPAQLVQIKQRIEEIDGIVKRLDDPALDVVAKLSLIDAAVGSSPPLHVGEIIGQSGTDAAVAALENENAGAGAAPGAGAVNGGGANAGAAMENAGATPAPKSAQESIIVPAVAVAPEWQRLDAKLRTIQATITEASRIYLPGHKKMIALNKQLDQVRKEIEVSYQAARHRLELERERIVDQQHYLEGKLPEYQEINRRFAKLQQDSHLHDAGEIAWQGIYIGAEKYINQLDYTADKERVNVQYMGVLDVRPDAVSPNKFNLFIFSLMLGGVLAFAVPFLIEYLDFTLSNLEEVEATFQMRGLGIVPKLISTGGKEMLLNVGDEATGDGNLIENFRVVRTNLMAMGTLSKPAHVTMVTSAMPKEGKTVIASNLAISFCKMGEKTLLIDTDIRRGRLHRLFGLRKSPGLSDVLLDKCPLEVALRKVGPDSPTILSAGQHMDSGTELLGSQKFTDLMQELRGRYERIIVDTPPVLGLSETSVLQNHMDGVLFVIWSGRTPIRSMKTALDILQTNGANFYGFVLNRLDLSATANYYQYYYYSSEYYHSYHALENA